VRVSGLEYLALATDLLQRARLTDPETGLWEAADLQWWWRTPRRSDAIDQVFWVDDEGPVAAVVLTDWGRAWGCDPIVLSGAAVPLAAVWTRAVAAIDGLGLEAVEVLARDDDVELLGLLVGAGFVAGDEGAGITWMDAQQRPDVAPLADGFVLVDRAQARTRPHPMRRRSGEEVEARLRQCSLYDPTLDLAVETADGEAAGSLHPYDARFHQAVGRPHPLSDGVAQSPVALPPDLPAEPLHPNGEIEAARTRSSRRRGIRCGSGSLKACTFP